MIKVNCNGCNKELLRSPSKVNPRNYCSLACYSRVRDEEISQHGEGSRYPKGHQRSAYDVEIQRLKCSGELHFAWKGEKVGYRGLHYWLIRKLGNPVECSECGKEKTTPKSIQWANIDGKYRRDVKDYIALCASCHKIKDLHHAKAL